MGMITLKEYAERNGKNLANMRQKAIRGGFTTAVHMGRDWIIDEDEPFIDNRIRDGKYVDWRKPKGDSKKPKENQE